MSEIYFEKIYEDSVKLNSIALWRDEALQTLRTSDYTAFGESQLNWIRNLKDIEKYFFIHNKIDDYLIGYCGLDKLHFANRTAEISLLISPEYRKQGYGKKAINKLLEYGFDVLNLNLIYGETYKTTNNFEFWAKCGFNKEAELKARKYWEGVYYNSIIFSITSEEWKRLGVYGV